MGGGSLTDVTRADVIVGASPAAVRLKAEIERVARYSSNILITGESGTGKELVARQVHALGRRAAQPFVPVDCASMTGELMASQLFGHVAGAFTGANRASLGCVRAAHRGTLFLDEIGELDYSLQAKLLRMLQERTVTPVGNHQGERVDVQVIAATNRNLREEVRAGRFREDLYYRLHVVHLRTTALRERAGDIPALAAAFLEQLAAEGLPRCVLSAGAERALVEYAWPGNVRQLRNVLEQATIDAPAAVIEPQAILSLLENDWDDGLAAPSSADGGAVETPISADLLMLRNPAERISGIWSTLASIERDHLVLTLEHTFYNRSAAARLLGITRQALLRKMTRHNIRAPGDSCGR